PYTTEYFERFAPILDLSQVARPNAEGTLDAKFWVDVGDEEWLPGPRETHPWSRGSVAPGSFPEDESRAALADLQRLAATSQGPGRSLVATGSPSLHRVHRTRVELDLAAGDERLEADLDAVARDRRITDVVVWADDDASRRLHTLGRVRRRLLDVPHVTALRVRSRRLVAEPASFTDAVTARLGEWNEVRVTRPLRLEVEIPVLHPSELGDGLGRVVRRVRRRGVSVYAVVPLLSFVNDAEADLVGITAACRRLGIEVHHLVVAGHPLQEEWATEHPVPVGRVVDLATALRRDGSGRELPRLILQTAFGEHDFGLTAVPIRRGAEGSLAFRLLAADLEGLRELDPSFELPPGVELDADGHPVAVVPGMTA
ncbi:MAG TPA: lysine 2,3-aminomutase, partial [Methylomirabilota bacterium]|nr:lysine 2,3-aminomutase [Methylomirabilota bacterium]